MLETLGASKSGCQLPRFHLIGFRGRADSNGTYHGRSNCFWRLMFPESQNRPAGCLECSIRFPIALYIASKLGEPVVGVKLRQRRVLRTAVPEAPVYEYSDTLAREYDVRAAAATERREVNSVTQPRCVQQAPDFNFGFRVSPTV